MKIPVFCRISRRIFGYGFAAVALSLTATLFYAGSLTGMDAAVFAATLPDVAEHLVMSATLIIGGALLWDCAAGRSDNL